MNIIKRTALHEEWMRDLIAIDERGLAQKHRDMADDLFKFLRATDYDWIAEVFDVCAEESEAPKVLSANDTHPGNGGTWRDAEARLIWGINDFDEAFEMPYTNDLIRLCTGVNVLPDLSIDLGDVCKAVLHGYEEGLASGGRPFALAEHHISLRTMAMLQLRDPQKFWGKLEALEEETVPEDVMRILRSSLPEGAIVHKVVSRWNAGEGSLGRPRFVMLAELDGGRIAREAKPVLPSASAFALGDTSKHLYIEKLLNCAVRCRDPFLQIKNKWIVRRLAPDCSHIDVSDLSEVADQQRLLKAFGFEVANIHLGTPHKVAEILKDLNNRPKGWLLDATEKMTRVTEERWKLWRQHMS